MSLIALFFWIAVFLVFYSYLGYGIFLWCYLKVSELFHKTKARVFDYDFLPGVTLVIATFNEEQIISEKIKNCFELDYPKDKINFLIVADGSNDETVNIVKKYNNIDLWYKPERLGKSAAINRVMPHINTPITIFTDANTFLNKKCVRNIVRHYDDMSVGAVAGEKKIITKGSNSTTAGGRRGIILEVRIFFKKNGLPVLLGSWSCRRTFFNTNSPL